MSDRGIPKSYRKMHGFGSHTYSFINAQNERFWVKFHYRSQQGIENLSDQESSELIGNDRESHQKDLFDNIENGNFPIWKLYVQIMTEEEANSYHINPFDLTKVWPHGDYPLLPVGEFVLNRNPENYFAEVEQSAFNPANTVPGIGFSLIKCYREDFFLWRCTALPIGRKQFSNSCKCFKVSLSRLSSRWKYARGWKLWRNKGYEPNSFGEWKEQPEFKEPVLTIYGDATAWDHREDSDYFSQPGNLFRLLTDEKKAIAIRKYR